MSHLQLGALAPSQGLSLSQTVLLHRLAPATFRAAAVPTGLAARLRAAVTYSKSSTWRHRSTPYRIYAVVYTKHIEPFMACGTWSRSFVVLYYSTAVTQLCTAVQLTAASQQPDASTIKGQGIIDVIPFRIRLSRLPRAAVAQPLSRPAPFCVAVGLAPPRRWCPPQPARGTRPRRLLPSR